MKALETETLERRHLKADLYMYYTVIAELVDLPVDEFFVFKQTITRNNGVYLYKHSFRYNAERYYSRIDPSRHGILGQPML